MIEVRTEFFPPDNHWTNQSKIRRWCYENDIKATWLMTRSEPHNNGYRYYQFWRVENSDDALAFTLAWG